MTLRTIALSLLVASCTEARIETPTEIAPTEITLTYRDAVSGNWLARLHLDDAGRLTHLDIDCGGDEYSRVSVGSSFPVNSIGARFSVYPQTTCEDGPVEVTVYALGGQQPADVPGEHVLGVFYFDSGALVGEPSIRGPEHRSPPIINE